VQSFNGGLLMTALSAIERRAYVLKGQSTFMEALGVPIRKRAEPTLTVPVVRKIIALKRPGAHSVPADPSIGQPMYQDILTLIHSIGRWFERLPSLYEGKDEEALRDHLIPYLESNFDLASPPGENFNKNGKTDILMRYEGKNVFVAECKFWSGQKNYFEAIDQALGYLTWRDSKASIIMFVKNKAMTATLQSVERDTPQHPQFARFHGKREETWFDYEFSLPQDKDRHIQLAVLCFHTPEER